MEDDFAGQLLGANTFTLRRFPCFGNNTTRAEWKEWQRRPRIFAADVALVRDVLPDRHALGDREPVAGQRGVDGVRAAATQVELHAVDGDYFTIKKYDLSAGRVIAPQEYEHGSPVVVIGDEVATHFFPNLDSGRARAPDRRHPVQVIGVIEHQGTLFGMSLDKLAIVPFKSPLHRLTHPRGDIGALLVQSPNSMMMNDVMEQVRETMRAHRQLHPGSPTTSCWRRRRPRSRSSRRSRAR